MILKSKYTALALAVGAVCAGQAQAQSNVTLYVHKQLS